jgi:hypothetical protein
MQGIKVNRSRATTAEVKSDWSYTSNPSISHHKLQKATLPYLLYGDGGGGISSFRILYSFLRQVHNFFHS